MATVTPETFTMVLYDHDAIAAAVDEVVATVGFPADEDVRVEVDEANPLARTHLLSIDPVVIAVDGGAFEDPRHPRQLSTDFVSVVVGRLILQALDRRDPAFGEPPPADAMPVAHRVAWDVYALGRLGRQGLPGPAPAPALQLPQPPRLHRRGRRRPSSASGPPTTSPGPTSPSCPTPPPPPAAERPS